ncbi:MAG: hypothetical protein J0M24_10690 [Verrucomicrobia bacterium]|nr:hypothetical protein [Verrucomicrobiota bacterium]
MSLHAVSPSHSITPGPVPLKAFIRDRGLSPVTVWRWRKRGWIQTFEIAGKPYLSLDSIREFERRAIAGEFAAVPRFTNN